MANLDIQIKSTANSAISTLDTLISRIDRLTTAIDRTKGRVESLNASFKNINNALTSKMSREVENTTKALNGVIDTATKASKKMQDLSKGTNRVTKALNRVGDVGTKGVTKIDKAILRAERSTKKFAFSIGKLYAGFNFLKHYSAFLFESFKNATDYQETVNLFAQALSDIYKDGLKTVRDMSRHLGIAEINLLKYQATFKNMIGALGDISEREAYKVSEAITKMALDYSSLYNVDIDESMNKFKAALAQQTRPIRNESGYDITEKTLENTLQRMGIDKSLKDLSLLEKRLLILNSLMDQLNKNGATNDFADTINFTASQVKIFKQQLLELSIVFGNLLKRAIGGVLPYLTGFIMTVTAMIKIINKFVGVVNEPIKPRARIDTYFGVDGLNDGLDKANKKMKKLKEYTLGFDELHVAREPEDSGNSGLDNVKMGGVDPRILEGLTNTGEWWKDVNLKATSIRNKLLDMLGIVVEIDDEGNEVFKTTEKTKKLIDRFLGILKFIAFLSTTITFAKMTNSLGAFLQSNPKGKFLTVFGKEGTMATGLKFIAGLLMKIGSLFGLVGAPAVAVGALVVAIVVAIGVAFVSLWKKSQKFRDIINGTLKRLEALGKMIYDAVLAPIIGVIKNVVDFFMQTLEILWTGFESVVLGVMAILMPIIDIIINFLIFLKPLFQVIGAIISGVIGFVGFLASGIVLAIGIVLHLVGALLQFIGDMIAWLRDNFLNIITFVIDLFVGFVDFVVGLIKGFVDIIVGSFKWAWDKIVDGVDWIKGKFDDFGNFINDIFQGVADFITGVWIGALNKIIDAINFLIDMLNAGGNLIEDLAGLAGMDVNLTMTRLEKIPMPTRNPKPQGMPLLYTGGVVKSGTLFSARENGITELVGNFGGQTAVMNNEDIIEAMAQAMSNNNGQDQEIIIMLDGKVLYREMRKQEKKQGYDLGYTG